MTTPDPVRFTKASDVAWLQLHGGWGPWRLDPEVRVLYVDVPYRYEVDLDRCLTSAEVLDWVCQISNKSWADDTILAGLVRALDDVLNPQARLCSDGRSKRLTRRQVAEAVAATAALGTYWPDRARNFGEWLSDHADDPGAIGDLARDAHRDPDWPGGDNLNVLRNHLRSTAASPEAIDTLERAWQAWHDEAPTAT